MAGQGMADPDHPGIYGDFDVELHVKDAAGLDILRLEMPGSDVPQVCCQPQSVTGESLPGPARLTAEEPAWQQWAGKIPLRPREGGGIASDALCKWWVFLERCGRCTSSPCFKESGGAEQELSPHFSDGMVGEVGVVVKGAGAHNVLKQVGLLVRGSFRQLLEVEASLTCFLTVWKPCGIAHGGLH